MLLDQKKPIHMLSIAPYLLQAAISRLLRFHDQIITWVRVEAQVPQNAYAACPGTGIGCAEPASSGWILLLFEKALPTEKISSMAAKRQSASSSWNYRKTRVGYARLPAE
jgi:hypothetical protein